MDLKDASSISRAVKDFEPDVIVPPQVKVMVPSLTSLALIVPQPVRKAFVWMWTVSMVSVPVRSSVAEAVTSTVLVFSSEPVNRRMPLVTRVRLA